MAKKSSWLCLFKRIFFLEKKQKQQHHKRRKRWLFGRLKRTKGLPPPPPPPSLPPPPPPPPPLPPPPLVQIKIDVNNDSQSKCEEDVPLKSSEFLTNEAKLCLLDHQHQDHVVASIKIQAAFRGYLARKALRALKGLVRLQAMIRGRAVRRQAMTTLKGLQSIVNIQSEVCARRSQMLQGKYTDLELHHLKNQEPKQTMGVEVNKHRRLDDKLMSKDEAYIDTILKKKEAILRRQRSKAYAFNHRNSIDSEDGNAERRLRKWLEYYVNDQASKKDDKIGGKQLKLRNIECSNNQNQNHNHRITSLPRRSFHTNNEDHKIPTYMAATESAKAKTRSMSSPRLRPVHFDAYSDTDSPYKHKFSPMSSINSELTCTSNKSSYRCTQQRSPSFKGLSGPVRSNKDLKDIY